MPIFRACCPYGVQNAGCVQAGKARLRQLARRVLIYGLAIFPVAEDTDHYEKD
jgi:hypothetical protein